MTDIKIKPTIIIRPAPAISIIRPPIIKLPVSSASPTQSKVMSSASPTQSSTLSSATLTEKYQSQKTSPVYQLPVARIKIMKGEFFYNYQTKNYCRDPTGWWYSEKLDGVHGIWTGAEMLSRTGNKIAVPDWWISQLPKNMALAGELFVSRKNFSEIQGLVHSKIPVSRAWQRVSFCLFDIPDSRLSFQENYQILQELIRTSSCSFLKLIPQISIVSFEHFLGAHRQLVLQGAEGTVIRDPSASYLPYQTDRLLKFKSQVGTNGEFLHLFDDVAVIVGYNLSDKWFKSDGKPGLRSLQVEWLEEMNNISSDRSSSKVQFSVSGHLTKDEKCGDYKSLFPIGSHIRILYNELNQDSGKPRFPRCGGLV